MTEHTAAPTRPSLPPELRERIDALNNAANQSAFAYARAALDAALLTIVQDAERLNVLDSLDTDALAMVTGRALDGESLRYLADIEIEQRARATTPEETPDHER